MALYGQGRITSEVLEVYRVASAHDGRDPLAILREGGFALPPMTDAQTPVKALYAARDYLLALDHPGAAEVRARLPVVPVRKGRCRTGRMQSSKRRFAHGTGRFGQIPACPCGGYRYGVRAAGLGDL